MECRDCEQPAQPTALSPAPFTAAMRTADSAPPQQEPEVWRPLTSPESSGRAKPHTQLLFKVLGWNHSIPQAPGAGTENASGLLWFSCQSLQNPGECPPHRTVSGRQKHTDLP